MAETETKFNVVFSTTLLEKLARDTPAGRERVEERRRQYERQQRQEADQAAAQRAPPTDSAGPSGGGTSALTHWNQARPSPPGHPRGMPGSMPPGIPGFLHFARPGGGAGRHEAAEEPLPADLAPIKRALAESEHVGALLLKREEEELSQVRVLAHRLHDQEYRAPSRPPPCAAHRDACLRCYSVHQQDPLQCADVVRAFTQCSREAQQAFVEASSKARVAER
ncbi:hypothetical protein KFL_004610080 [Klebsormidium nitens]|uniref:Uncharacterized protein n=1 Tax=Klebsormidium nitens TaxID=105231 RepID=A0A1Y1IDZ4_KLENI|nr:hypothetical protein KFL_004610080 [Klebsormidium nitens]|eukprot:GAQ88813.1 hypothetical protein KFL_004610080 [Klebsormidium nitens]